ncbi:MAG TPA: twin transmembrane helix small protein [Bauldia sp.]|nr:twin transmembrane helix small protein [Bauldia sp.]
MESFLHGATFAALAAVSVVLVLGVINMMRGTSPNRSQTLMRWRVILQFVALVVMMTALYFASRG